MASNVYDITLYQGDSFSLVVNAQDDNGNALNLSGFSGFAGIKSAFCSSGYLGFFNINISNPTGGEITMTMPSTGTANLPATVALYDLEIASGNFVTKYLQGDVYIYPQINNIFP